LEAVLLGIINL